MTLTIGRASVEDPEKVTASGARITLEGDIAPSGLTDAAKVGEFLARRQQIVGMIDNPDMDVWPVTWTEDPTIDGFYWVRRAEVTPADVALTAGHATYRVELERPSGLASPLIECTTLSAVMTNSHAVAGSSTIASVWAVPNAALSVDPPAIVSGVPAAGSRTAEDGALKLWRVYNASGTGVWTVEPGDFFDSSATIEAVLSGTDHYPLPGRSVPLTPDNWRVSNGLVRVSASATSGKLFDLSFWDTTWCTAQAFGASINYPVTPSYNYSGTYNTLQSVAIVRNSPEACTVRLTVKPSSTSGTSTDQVAVLLNSHATIDVTVRRGEPLARCVLTPRNITGYLTVGVGSSGGAQTSITGGYRADSTVNGGRLLIASPSSLASSTTIGTPGLRSSASRSSLLFGIGYEIDGASASTYNTAQQVAYQYLMTLSERQEVVLR